MTEATQPCLNCESPLRDDDRYCAHCGQKRLPSKLPLGELLREVASETFELDGRVFRTLVPFLFRPGFLTREFNRGRRASYTSPFRLFLAATLLWLLAGFVVEQRTDFDAKVGDEDIVRVDTGPVVEGSQDKFSRWLVERGAAFEELPEAEQAHQATVASTEALPKATLAMVPVFALLLTLLFVRKDRYYVEHLVFALHVHAFAFVVAAIAVLIPVEAVRAIAALAVLAYVYVALWKAYEVRWWTAALRMLVILFVHGIVLTVATAFMILGTLLMG